MRIDQLRILVVDDHGFQRWALRNMLNALGARDVLLAHDGAAAMQVLRDLDLAVDIIITDLDMPGMDGMELIRNLARERLAASLIVTSGLGRGVLTSVKAMGDAYGVHVIAALEKPASMRVLREAIEKHASRTLVAPRASCITAVEVAGALHEDEIEARFEPRVDIASRAIVAAQVAVVWAEPCGRVTGADAFVDIARTAGLAPRLGWQLLHKSMAACAAWRRDGLQAGVCVPIGAESLRDPGYAQRVRGSAAAAGLDPAAVMLQFDAAYQGDGLGTMLENLSRLRMLGFGVALPYGPRLRHREDLAHAPCSELAIAAAVARAECSESDRPAVVAGAEAAREAGLSVSVHGIASRDDWNLAVALGAHTATGPGLGTPLLAEAFAIETARRPVWKGYR
jgi:EAL domain-containing protein (putative c-di-GMP-specific phosphodiesterase class I)/CheY-like chemotaxis protein